jgi:hypothetical protein
MVTMFDGREKRAVSIAIINGLGKHGAANAVFQG